MTARHRHDAGQHGYTLVELLTTVSILAVLASIAVPMVTSQRESAWRSAAATDARNAAVAVESVSQGGYPAAAQQQGRVLQILSADADAAPLAVDVPMAAGATGDVLAESPTSPGVRLDYHHDGDARYCLCAYHDRLDGEPVAVYDSAAGGLVDACGIDADDVCGADLAGQVYEGLEFVSSGHWGPNPLHGGPDGATSGTLVLHDVAATGDTNGGWSISYGEFDDATGRMTGYEVQFNRVLGEFRVMPWVNGGQREAGSVRHATPAGMDLTSNESRHDTVRVDVHAGSLALWIDDEQVLSHDVSDVNGTFAIRDFHGTTVDHGDVTLTVQ